MNGLLACCCAQTEFVWKLVDLYGRRTDWRSSPFMGGVVLLCYAECGLHCCLIKLSVDPILIPSVKSF
jgi:hypothetical protein